MLEHPLRISLDTCNCYAYQGTEGWLLVDTGGLFRPNHVLQTIRHAGIEPSDIKVVILSHIHFDHVRGLRSIIEASGAQVLCHRAEAPFLRLGTNAPSTGMSLLSKALINFAFKLSPLLRVDPFSPTFLIDKPISLASTGFSVRVLPTPGHTSGSITAIAGEKYAFVGDLAVNRSTKCGDNFLPPFVENLSELFQSWQTVLESGVTTICPAHGRPFAARRLKTFMEEKLAKAYPNLLISPQKPPESPQNGV
jgi:glyoxylase-like metal-dependent hydrolase (beta-lactamase superfamily II)